MKPVLSRTQHRDFALIVTFSLMILLTVIAVSLLSLSAITLRTTSQSAALATAQVNARMALMLAIGDLQKQAGPDQRVSAHASLVGISQNPDWTEFWRADQQNSQPKCLVSGNKGLPSQTYAVCSPEKFHLSDSIRRFSGRSG